MTSYFIRACHRQLGLATEDSSIWFLSEGTEVGWTFQITMHRQVSSSLANSRLSLNVTEGKHRGINPKLAPRGLLLSWTSTSISQSTHKLHEARDVPVSLAAAPWHRKPCRTHMRHFHPVGTQEISWTIHKCNLCQGASRPWPAFTWVFLSRAMADLVLSLWREIKRRNKRKKSWHKPFYFQIFRP